MVKPTSFRNVSHLALTFSVWITVPQVDTWKTTLILVQTNTTLSTTAWNALLDFSDPWRARMNLMTEQKKPARR